MPHPKAALKTRALHPLRAGGSGNRHSPRGIRLAGAAGGPGVAEAAGSAGVAGRFIPPGAPTVGGRPLPLRFAGAGTGSLVPGRRLSVFCSHSAGPDFAVNPKGIESV